VLCCLLTVVSGFKKTFVVGALLPVGLSVIESLQELNNTINPNNIKKVLLFIMNFSIKNYKCSRDGIATTAAVKILLYKKHLLNL
jgi:hypothetical protein